MAEEDKDRVIFENELPEVDMQTLGNIIGPMIASMIIRTPANHGGGMADVLLLLESINMCVLMTLVKPECLEEVAEQLGKRLVHRLAAIKESCPEDLEISSRIFTRH